MNFLKNFKLFNIHVDYPIFRVDVFVGGGCYNMNRGQGVVVEGL